MDAVLRLIDGVDIKCTHNFGCDARFTIDDAYHLTSFGGSGVWLQGRKIGERPTTEVFSTTDLLLGCAIPDTEKDAL